MDTWERARKFVYRNARPLDLARWKFHFENGSRDDVWEALAAYQNENGGFGHGLEADCFNPHSSPIQTWAATEILQEIGGIDPRHPIVRGILRYLESGADFDAEQMQWLNVVPSNNDYPHAIWWSWGDGGSEFKYNPSAALAGFAIRYAERGSEVYSLACEIAQRVYDWFTAQEPFEEMHITGCLVRLYEYCVEAGATLFDMDVFRQKLIAQVDHNICKDTGKWNKEYVTLPSNFIRSRESTFYAAHKDLVEAECRAICEQQTEDGAFPVMWKWWTNYSEYGLSVNWWKADFCIRNMLFLREFGGSGEACVK